MNASVAAEWYRWKRGGAPRRTWTYQGKELPVFYADMSYKTASEQLPVPGRKNSIMMRCVQCGGWAGLSGESFTMWTDDYFASCRACDLYAIDGHLVLFADGTCGVISGGMTEND